MKSMLAAKKIKFGDILPLSSEGDLSNLEDDTNILKFISAGETTSLFANIYLP